MNDVMNEDWPYPYPKELLYSAGILPREVNEADDDVGGAEGERRHQPPQAQLLLELARDVELFHTPDGEAWAVVPVGDHQETWPIRAKAKGGGNRLGKWLRLRFFDRYKRPPSAQALSDALATLEAMADAGRAQEVFCRVAAAGEAVYLDLGGPEWRAVEVTAEGWRIVQDPPVRFKRPRGLLPLPEPERGGSLEELRPFVNLADEAGWRLLVAWLVGALSPWGPYPILILQGEQGSAKSTTARVLRALVDPNAAPLRTAPRDERDLTIAANNGWLLAADNLSGIPPWLSDAFCRIATGGGFATRELYSDADEVIFEATRPVLLNGIEAVATRHDLLDRAIILDLPPIPEERRRPEADFWAAFEVVRPRVLGALLDAVAAALRNRDTVRLERLPRMADFAVWVTAAEEALPWPAGGFMEAYAGNRAEAVEAALEADAVAAAVRSFMESRETWEGTATELLNELEAYAPERAHEGKGWPNTPQSLSGRLRRAATFLRQVGIDADWGSREPGTGRRLWVLKRLKRESIVTVVTPVTEAKETRTAQGFLGVTVGVTMKSPIVTTVTESSQQKPLQDAVCDNCDGCDEDSATFSTEDTLGGASVSSVSSESSPLRPSATAESPGAGDPLAPLLDVADEADDAAWLARVEELRPKLERLTPAEIRALAQKGWDLLERGGSATAWGVLLANAVKD
ncbi:MAG: hypothetical protein KM310_10765 [Clostridiales bacterium]|nr:hypothetical protein [Clostridiales bacterium]